MLSRGENYAPADPHRPHWPYGRYKYVRDQRGGTADAPRDALVSGKFAGPGSLRELRRRIERPGTSQSVAKCAMIKAPAEGGLTPELILPSPRVHGMNLYERCGRSSGVEHNLAKVGVEGSNPFARSSCHLAEPG
jgi:hypothetical protein